MAGFIKKHRKSLLFLIFVFSVGLFLIFYLNKNTSVPAIKYSLEQCETNTGYSVAYDVKADYHKDKTISHILVEGAIEESNSLYRRIEEEITIYHIFDTDINNILNSENKINYDTWDKEVYSADFKGEKIGKGAIFIEVLCWNDFGEPQIETLYYTDVLNGAVKNSKEELVKIEKKECDIRILFVYKVANKYETSSEDFRVNYLIKVRNGAANEVFPKTIEPAKNFADEIPAQVPANTDIIKGSTVFNGFYLDFKNNQFYTAEVYRNDTLEGIYNYISIRIRGGFTDEGVYRIVNKNAFNEEDEFYVTVDRYRPAGKFKNIDIDPHGKYTFEGWTSFELDEPLGGFDYRSPVTMEISKNGGGYVPYKSGEKIKKAGEHSIRLRNDLFTNIIYNFTVKEVEAVETVIPTENYLNLKSLNKDIRPAKYYAFDVAIDSGKKIYCFSFDDPLWAYERAIDLEWDNEVIRTGTKYIYRNDTYDSAESVTAAVYSYVEENIYIKYDDRDIEQENLECDPNMLYMGGIPYLNDFVFKEGLVGHTVYYIRLEDHPEINEHDWKTALNIAKLSGSILEYDIPAAHQLALSGTYLILDTNINGQTYPFKAYFVKDNNAKIKIDYAVNQNEARMEVMDGMEFPYIVDYFRITSITDIYDIYTIVKVVSGDRVDYYTADDLKSGSLKSYYENGTYHIVCYDRNFNSFEFDIIVKCSSPDGGIRLEGVDDGVAYDCFTIYFDINFTYFKIIESQETILLIEGGIVKINIYDYDETEGCITIEKKSAGCFYWIYFTGNDGDLKEYNVCLI